MRLAAWADCHPEIVDQIRMDASKAHFINTVQLMSEALLIVDTDGLIVEWNPAAEDLFGYPKEEAVGQPASMLHANKTEDVQREIVVQTLHSDGKFLGEVQCIRKDGKEITVEVSLAQIRDENGILIGNIGVNRDVTEQRKVDAALIDSEQRYRDLSEGSLQGIFVHRNLELLYANESLVRIFGFDTVDDFMQLKSLMEIIHVDDRKRVRDQARRRANGEEVPSFNEGKGITTCSSLWRSKMDSSAP